VALVVTRMPPGGKERVVMHLASDLRALGVETMIVCLVDKGEFGQVCADGGLRVEALNSQGSWDCATIARLSKLLKGFRPDVINVHDRHSVPYAFLAAGFGWRYPLVVTCHGLLMQDAEGRWPERLAMRGVRVVTAVSDQTIREYSAMVGWSGPVEIIVNGVDAVARDPVLRTQVRKEIGLSDDEFVFLAVGNVNPEKGYEDLLAATSVLWANPPTRRPVVLVAGGTQNQGYVARLESIAQRLSLQEKVRFLGQRSDVQALYSAADAFVLSSRKEGHPMVLLEAMGAGLPVIATRVGGVPTVVEHEENGLLVPPESPQELAAAMRRLMDDDELARRLGQAAHGRISDGFSVRTMTMKYLAAYGRAMRTR
jgi:glycosyltransferase involved in cell wall biosynthesis